MKTDEMQEVINQRSIELNRLHNYVRQMQADNLAQDHWKTEQQQLTAIIKVVQ